jgi:hypothetical protein
VVNVAWAIGPPAAEALAKVAMVVEYAACNINSTTPGFLEQ